MTLDEKIKTVKTLVGNDVDMSESDVSVYLSVATDAILNKRYPFGRPVSVTEVPRKYDMLLCRLAARYILRRGGEGEIAHGENGISRTYASVDDADLLDAVTPVAKVVFD